MHVTGIFALMAVVIVKTAAASLLTGDNVHNSTKQDLVGVNGQNVDVFRQLLNQETLIRMNLVQNVQALMKDMLNLKQNLAVAEQKYSTLQASTDHEISVLKTEVQTLKLENDVLKKESRVQRRHLAEMQKNITQIYENHEEFRRNIDVDRKTFEINVSHTLADINVEVRNLSITLMDLNTHTRQIENGIPDMIDQNILGMFESLNSSLENFNARLMDTGNKFSAQVSELKYLHSRVLSTVTGLKKKVAFTAGTIFSSTTWESGTLVFPTIILNIGNGYNTNTGIFTAPTYGYYVFFVSIVEYDKQHNQVCIVHNGLSKVTTMADSSAGYQTGANMAVLRLNTGDKVWIRYVIGKGFYTQSVPLTTFSGFLL